MNLISVNTISEKNSLHQLIQRRVDDFRKNGLNVKTSFHSKVDSLEQLSIGSSDFNRILFSILSSLLQTCHKDRFTIETKNCEKFFTLSLSCNRGSFLPPRNGIFSPSKQFSDSAYWKFVLSSLKESGGNLIFKKKFPCQNEISLQIPLSFVPESIKEDKALLEGLFFNLAL